MGVYHNVVQDEHLSSIAKKYGFSDYKIIWNHDQNAELKKKTAGSEQYFSGRPLVHSG